ncbi:hypothetical protein [uncultured Winogradskyella sp.]|uniref:hypothetical protein n=1 Tax=uncultured Winogradskyella sp. TaxID=395353 RepID=UPI0030DBA312
MKKSVLLLFTVLISTMSYAQPWMKSLRIAQDLALVENKMVLMVWEGTTKYPYPVTVNDNKGNTIFIKNLFEDEYLSPLIWKHFVPVIVSEDRYGEMYAKIKGKRPVTYIDKFNDDSIKILDVNGTILNRSLDYSEYTNITKLIETYALNTTIITPELTNYRNGKNFYSVFYLASKYLDLALYSNAKVRPEVMRLGTIYINEARAFLKDEKAEDVTKLNKRLELLELHKDLIFNKPKKVLRRLQRMEKKVINESNKPYSNFLYFTAYALLNNTEKMQDLKPSVSSINLKRAQWIVNLNR